MDPPPRVPLLPQLPPSHRSGSWSLEEEGQVAAVLPAVLRPWTPWPCSTSACHSGGEIADTVVLPVVDAAAVLGSTSPCHSGEELAAAVVLPTLVDGPSAAVGGPCHAGGLLWLWLRPISVGVGRQPPHLFCALLIGVPRFSLSLSPLNPPW